MRISHKPSIGIQLNIPGIISGHISDQLEVEKRNLGINPVENFMIQPQAGESNVIKRPIIGFITGFDDKDIEKLGLVVFVSIKTDIFYPQGIAKVRQGGEWTLEEARFGAVSHLLRLVLKDKSGTEYFTKDYSITVKRETNPMLEDLSINHEASFYPEKTKESGKKHYWIRVWIDGSSPMIENVNKVVYHLHESFVPPERELKNRSENFEFKTYCYGAFMLTADVYFKDSTKKIKLSRFITLKT